MQLVWTLGARQSYDTQEANMFGQPLRGAVIGGQTDEAGPLSGRMASNESPVRYQVGDNVAEPRAE